MLNPVGDNKMNKLWFQIEKRLEFDGVEMHIQTNHVIRQGVVNAVNEVQFKVDGSGQLIRIS